MDIDELIAHYRKLIGWMNEDIADFESGHRTMGANRGGRMIDISAEYTVELRQKVAELEKIVTAHEARRPI